MRTTGHSLFAGARIRRVVGAVAVAVAALGLSGFQPAVAMSGLGAIHPAKPHPAKMKPVVGHEVTRTAHHAPAVQHSVRKLASVSWPKAAAGDLVATSSRRSTLPSGVVGVASATTDSVRAHVELLDHATALAAGVDGVLVHATLPAGVKPAGVRLSVNYGSFAGSAGGDWAGRLRLVELPACSLIRPGTPACRTVTQLTTHNNVATHQLTTSLVHPNSVLAAQAAAQGSTGDYAATPLASSSSWNSGGSSGAFNWSYPLKPPPSAGGLDPSLSIEYDSSSVDGRTASSNNQPSSIGEGFALNPGFISRGFLSCADAMTGGNNSVKTGDLCWSGDTASLSLAGHSGRLIKDSTTGAWHLGSDDGSRIQRLTGSSNGAYQGEYWVLTTTDGTQYYFGSDNPYTGAATNSTWTVPVFGNKTGQRCHQATFAASACDQAWQWNLDYVVDVHGNSMTYNYATETNRYQEDNEGASNPGTSVQYTRGGYLTEIDYGKVSTNESAAAPDRVTFTQAERCLPTTGITCAPSELTSATASSWPDVPFDQICTSTSACTDSQSSPTFFSRKRITGLTTQVRTAGTYHDVDSWALTQDFPDPGDGTTPGLFLDQIQHTGHNGGTLTLAPVTFQRFQYPNRVDNTNGDPALLKWRVTSVTSETGEILSINYSDPTLTPLPAGECDATHLPSAPESNTLRCYPTWWASVPGNDPTLNWFYKYVVLSVVQSDPNALSPDQVTTYKYLGNPGWHYDDPGQVAPKYRTWSQYRGYSKVQTILGAPGQTQSMTQTLFMQGMDGDHLPSGTRSASITDSTGHATTDSNDLSGMTRESITYNGPTGAEVSGAINDFWRNGPLATDDDGTKAYMDETAVVNARQDITSPAGVRKSTTTTTFDTTYGLPTQVDSTGDTALTGDETCTRYTYGRNTAKWIITPVVEQQVVDKLCSVTPSIPADVVSDSLTLYDLAPVSGTIPTTQTPTFGDPTQVQKLTGTATSAAFVNTAETAYDALGRTISATDALGATTTTGYVPADNNPTTSIVTTNPAPYSWLTTKTLDPARAETLSITDPNNHTTTSAYDAVGRLTGVWEPGRTQGTDTPNTAYSYALTSTGPSVVSTTSLQPNGSTTTSYTLYDAMLRERQTQAPPAQGAGTVLTDTVYDTRGNVITNRGPYYSNSTLTGQFFAVADNQMPTQTATVFDGAGRVTTSTLQSNGVDKWHTTTSYNGNSVTVLPPAGASATATLLDAEGRTTSLQQYHAATATGAHNDTTYHYDAKGNLDQVVSGAATWTYTYDLRGRRTGQTDPDTGTTSTAYTNDDKVQSTQDARTKVLWTDYDALGRKIDLRTGSSSGPIVSSWAYDTLAKGQLDSATSFVGTNAYVRTVTGYDDHYRPTGSQVTLPASEGVLQGTYATTNTYKATGQLDQVGLPTIGGLPTETMHDLYTSTGAASGLGGLGSYVIADRTPLGEPFEYTLGSDADHSAFQTYTYDDATRRVLSDAVDRQNTTSVALLNYTYDPAGNVTNIKDAAAGQTLDNQCFTYDTMRRLTAAWTPKSGVTCATAASVANLGGAAPYWLSWTYTDAAASDASGNRFSQTLHMATNTVTQYTYAAAGHVHGLSKSVATTGATAVTNTYTYDASGNAATRKIGTAATQTLTYDEQGRIASDVTAAGTTSYVYDADGTLLLRKGPTENVAYLPNAIGRTELHLAHNAGSYTATRYYMFDGKDIALRTATGVTTLISDDQGTAFITIDPTTQAYTKRYQTPFGTARGTAVTWPGQDGFLGKPVDATTALTTLGARQYDPVIGRFTSPDPVMDSADPQSLSTYAYADNTPITSSDPSGLRAMGTGGEECGDACNVSRTERIKHGIHGRLPETHAGASHSDVRQHIDNILRGDSWAEYISLYPMNTTSQIRTLDATQVEAAAEADAFIESYVSSGTLVLKHGVWFVRMGDPGSSLGSAAYNALPSYFDGGAPGSEYGAGGGIEGSAAAHLGGVRMDFSKPYGSQAGVAEADAPSATQINRQKQDGHIAGTAQHTNRLKTGKPTSTWLPGVDPDALTWEAWQNGTPVAGQSTVRLYDFGTPIGEGGYGGTQTQVRVTSGKNGTIHGSPWGPVTR
jgi:RHS repeat-associated protein